MLWFQHDTNAEHDPKIKKLLMKYSNEGYGFYFRIVERIASRLSSRRISFELEDDDEILAHDFVMSIDDVREIKEFCIEIDLFQLNPDSGNVCCYALVNRLDNSISQSPEIKKLKASKDFKKLKEILNDFKEFKEPYKSLKQRRGEKRRGDITTTVRSENLKFLRIQKIFDEETDVHFEVEVYENGEYMYSRPVGSEDELQPLMSKTEFYMIYPDKVQ